MANQNEQKRQSSIDYARDQVASSIKTTWRAVKSAKKLAQTAKKALSLIKITGQTLLAGLASGGAGAVALVAKEAAVKLGKWALHKAEDAVKGLLSLGWLIGQKQKKIEQEKTFIEKHKVALAIASLLAFVVFLPFLPFLIALPKMSALITSSPN